MQPERRVTLLTDFGLRDGYVAAMKGVLLHECGQADIIDACHAIPPQDVKHASWVISQYAPLFPPQTLHVAVVDPGVGTARRIWAGRIDHQFYLAPDNGLLDVLIQRAHAVDLRVLKPDWHRPERCSSTFHGRDVFAYTAGQWMNGTPVSDFSVTSPAPRPSPPPATPSLLTWDHFGNMITTFTRDQLPTDKQITCVRIGDREITAFGRCYADVSEGEWIALFGSDGLLEIGIRNGSAAEKMKNELTRGMGVTLSFG